MSVKLPRRVPCHAPMRTRGGGVSNRRAFCAFLVAAFVLLGVLADPIGHSPSAAAATASIRVKPVETAGPGEPIVPQEEGECSYRRKSLTDPTLEFTVEDGDLDRDYPEVIGCTFGRAYVLDPDGVRRMEITRAELVGDRVVITPAQGAYFPMQDQVQLSLTAEEARTRLVVEFWQTGKGLPITYEYPREDASLGMTISGNDFKLKPDNVQFYAADAKEPGTWCADARINVARGYALSIDTADRGASVTASMDEDLSAGKLEGLESFSNLRTVRIYHICYTNPNNPQKGTVSVRATSVKAVRWNASAVPGVTTASIDKWGRTSTNTLDYRNIADTYGYQYRYGYSYTLGLGTYNISKMVNPFFYKVNVPTQDTKTASDISKRTNVGVRSSDNGATYDSYAPEAVAGTSSLAEPVGASRLDVNKNVFDFYAQTNGLPYLFLNNSDSNYAPPRTWNYFLSKVSVNGQWMAIPLPEVFRLDTESSEDHYRDVRNESLGGLDIYSLRDQPWADRNKNDWRRCYINNGRTDRLGKKVSDAAGAHVYSPDNGRAPFYSATFDSGPLAGTRVEVTLVNIRNGVDARGWGWHTSDSSAYQYWSEQRDYENNPIKWWWSGGFWGDNENNNEAPLNSSPAPSFAPAMQLNDISACSKWLDFTFANGKFRTFRQMNAWKLMYRIRIVNPTTEDLDVKVRFDSSVNGAVWNAGSIGIEFEDDAGTTYPTFGSTLKNSDNSAFEMRPVCAAQLGEPRGCVRAFKKWMPGKANDGTQPRFTYRLKDGYGEPVVELQTGLATGRQEHLDATRVIKPEADPDTAQSAWAKLGDDRGNFTFGFTDNRNPVFCEDPRGSDKTPLGDVITCDGRYAAVGYSGQYGARVTARVISVPVNYRDRNGELYQNEHLINGEKVNRVYANRYLLQGPVPISEDGKLASRWKLMGVRSADHPKGPGEEEIATDLLPGEQIDIKTIGGDGVELVNRRTGRAAYSELYLTPVLSDDERPNEDGPLVYPVTRRVGDVPPGTEYDFFGTYLALPGLQARYIGTPPSPLPVEGTLHYFDRENSTLTLDLNEQRAPLVLFYSPRESTVIFNKKWEITSGTGAASQTVTYEDGRQPPQLSSSYTVDGTSSRWGIPVSAAEGQPLAFRETTSTTSGFEGCVLTGVRIESSDGAPPQELSAQADGRTVATQLPGYSVDGKNVRVKNNVAVSHHYVSTDPRYSLPTSIAEKAPAASTVAYGERVAAPIPDVLQVEDPEHPGYTWWFVGWTQRVYLAYNDIVFTGRWERVKNSTAIKPVTYMWEWATPSEVALPVSGLPALPALYHVDVDTRPAPYPDGVAKGVKYSTELGEVTVAGSRTTPASGVVVITLDRPAEHEVKYTYEVFFRGQPVSGPMAALLDHPNARKYLEAALPASRDVSTGEKVRPDVMRDVVVNLRQGYDWGGAAPASLTFTGWREDSPLVVGSEDVLFTAKFTLSVLSGEQKDRGIQYTNVSGTNETATSAPIRIPERVDEAMRQVFANDPAYYVAQRRGTGSGASPSTWVVPDLIGTEISDPVLRGTWRLKEFKRVQASDGALVEARPGSQVKLYTDSSSPAADEFPRIGSDDRNWIADFGGTTPSEKELYVSTLSESAKRAARMLRVQEGNRNLQMIAVWEFMQAPTYTVTNKVTCNTSLVFRKEIGRIDDAVPGVESAPSPDQWTLAASSPSNAENDSWQGAGLLDLPGGDASGEKHENQRILNGLSRLALSETARAGSDPSLEGLYVPSSYQCTAGALEDIDLTSGTASLYFGLGQKMDCTVVNTSAQITLLAGVRREVRTTSMDAAPPTLEATKPAAPAGLEDIVVRSADTTATVDTTEMLRPNADYALGVSRMPLGYLFLGYEHYTGATPNAADLMSASDWEPLSAQASARAPVGGHVVYRAVFSPFSAPDLPFTGGLSRDAFLIAGAGAVALAALIAWAHRRRREEETARS